MSGKDTDNLYITGLPAGCSEQLVKDIFSQYGTVQSVKLLPANPQKGDAAAMVRMGDNDQAKWLIDNVNGNIPQGLSNVVAVKPANPVGQGGWSKGEGKGKGKGGPMMNPQMMMMMMQMMKGK